MHVIKRVDTPPCEIAAQLGHIGEPLRSLLHRSSLPLLAAIGSVILGALMIVGAEVRCRDLSPA
jgi:hypothetical protein